MSDLQVGDRVKVRDEDKWMFKSYLSVEHYKIFCNTTHEVIELSGNRFNTLDSDIRLDFLPDINPGGWVFTHLFEKADKPATFVLGCE